VAAEQGTEILDPPPRGEADGHAIAVWNYLSNGMGGLDWSGLPLVTEYLGITDIEGLMARLIVIKTHRRDEPSGAPNDGADKE
jgi:hypothetical protein